MTITGRAKSPARPRRVGMAVIGKVLKVGFLALIGLAIGGIGILLFFGWSSSVMSSDFDACAMRAIEANISVSDKPSYLTACMGSKGYKEARFCFAADFKSASCFIPRSFFWVN